MTAITSVLVSVPVLIRPESPSENETETAGKNRRKFVGLAAVNMASTRPMKTGVALLYLDRQTHRRRETPAIEGHSGRMSRSSIVVMVERNIVDAASSVVHRESLSPRRLRRLP